MIARWHVKPIGTEEDGPDKADRGAIGWNALPDSSAKEDRAVAADVPGDGRELINGAGTLDGYAHLTYATRFIYDG
jgi:hypothetical protein